MTMKKMIISMMLLCSFFGTKAQVQKIAFIDETKVLESIPGYNRSLLDLDSIKTVMSNEFNMLRNRNNEKVKNILKNYNVQSTIYDEIYKMLAPEDKKKMDVLKDEQETLMKSAKLKEDYIKSEYEQKILPFLNNVNRIVKEYCMKRKIVALYKIDKFDSGMAYVDEKVEITKEIINLLNGSR